ncbi:hypothetical protein CMUS01_06474 [Colletotrichum musicola]|uniref:Uncharacterized protein n=1 Tax=Colletotrichum musicola TaxID=2175873 RepID=A0A8H6NHA8_9PEZI|nr:hypothetical protein CMUS01_06474 [Colletotrichum musicola]
MLPAPISAWQASARAGAGKYGASKAERIETGRMVRGSGIEGESKEERPERSNSGFAETAGGNEVFAGLMGRNTEDLPGKPEQDKGTHRASGHRRERDWGRNENEKKLTSFIVAELDAAGVWLSWLGSILKTPTVVADIL